MMAAVAFISGLVMAWGLVLSGMIDPAKVLGFLDIFGRFDPTLAFVMAGALAVTAFGFNLRFRQKPLLCEQFDLPVKKEVDMPLILGAVLFGAGWGLAGFCPGPALAGSGTGTGKVLVFVMAMLVGMWLARTLMNRGNNK